MVETNEINTAIVFSNLEFWILQLQRLINNIKENVSERVIITEVKFIKKFLHACVKIAMERDG